MSSEAPASLQWRRRIAALDAVLAALVMITILRNEFSLTNASIAVFAALPLLAPLPRLAAGARRTYAAVTLIVIPYVVFSLMEAAANPTARAWASACALVSVVLFVMLIGYVRATRP